MATTSSAADDRATKSFDVALSVWPLSVGGHERHTTLAVISLG